MRTAIIGAGSMGTVMAAYMARDGVPVEVIDANVEHVNVMKTTGATVVHLDPQYDFTVKLNAYTPDKMNGIYDLVILLTKQTANKVVLPNLLNYIGPDSIVCTLQNGVPEPSVAEVVGKQRTIGGTMLYGGTWLRPGVSQMTSTYEFLKSSSFDLGELEGLPTPRLDKVKELLDHVGNTHLVDNLMNLRWTKLLLNCCGSGLSAALNCTFGDVVDNTKSLLAEAIVAKECIDVCHAEGHRMNEVAGFDIETLYWNDKKELRTTMDNLVFLYRNSKAGKASMLQDLEKQLPTEIDYINGYTVTRGAKHGLATPVNQRIVELVKEAEARKGVNDFSYISRFDDVLADYQDMY